MGATIRVNMFGVGSRRRKVQPTATTLREEPHTLRELIAQCVEVCVERHNRRAENNEPTNPSDEEVDEMAKVGKVADRSVVKRVVYAAMDCVPREVTP